MDPLFQHLYQNLMDHNYFPEMYGKDPKFTVKTAFKACDAVISNEYADSKQDPELYKECFYLKESTFFVTYSSEESRKTALTEMVQLISKYLLKKSTGKLPELQLLLLSGHDTTLVPLISVFYPKNIDCILDEYNKIYNEK